jgi:putative DNA primase/helicase
MEKISELKRNIQGKARFLAESVADIPSDCLTGKHSQCPLHGGKNDFRFDDKTGLGSWICTCGHGDIFDLVMQSRKCSFSDAMHLISEALNGAPALPALERIDAKVKERDIEKNRRSMEQLWHSAKPLTIGDPAHTYLSRTRRITISQFNCLRFHECAPYKIDETTERHPSLLAAFIKDGQMVQVQRTALTLDGHKAFEKPGDKRLMPGWTLASGGAVRLFEPFDVLGVAEGVETALAAKQLTGIPTWACLTAKLLEKVVVPNTVREVVIFADNDQSQTGQNSAATLALRLTAEDRQVRIMTPNVCGTDFADLVLRGKI